MVHKEPDSCALCGRNVLLTFHHLIPRKVHGRTFFKKNYSKEALNMGVELCRPCHRGVHKLYGEMELAKRLSTLDALRADSAIQSHVRWVAKQKSLL